MLTKRLVEGPGEARNKVGCGEVTQARGAAATTCLRFGFGVVSPARGVGVGVDVGVDLRLGSLGRRRFVAPIPAAASARRRRLYVAVVSKAGVTEACGTTKLGCCGVDMAAVSRRAGRRLPR